MALIEVGSINNFAVSANSDLIKHKPFLRSIRSISALNEVSKQITESSFELITSKDRRGVGLKSIKLTEGFEGFMQNFLNKTNEIYFLAWAWDLSGEAVNLYPGAGVEPNKVLIPIKVGVIREFFGEGINLFPKRFVKGGIALRIQLWESDEKTRNVGKAMSETADAINNSKLNNLLSTISIATGVSGATITLIKDAALELTSLIGKILEKNGDDYVDFFEGYYSSDQEWITGNENQNGNASILTLNKY